MATQLEYKIKEIIQKDGGIICKAMFYETTDSIGDGFVDGIEAQITRYDRVPIDEYKYTVRIDEKEDMETTLRKYLNKKLKGYEKGKLKAIGYQEDTKGFEKVEVLEDVKKK